MFLRLREGAVDDAYSAVPDAYRRRGLDRLKRFRGDQQSAAAEPVAAGCALAIRHCVQFAGFEVDETGVLHVDPFVVRGPWSVVRGPWAVGRGPWAAGRGPRACEFNQLQLSQAAFQQSTLGFLPSQLERALERDSGVSDPAGAPREFSSGCVREAV